MRARMNPRITTITITATIMGMITIIIMPMPLPMPLPMRTIPTGMTRAFVRSV